MKRAVFFACLVTLGLGSACTSMPTGTTGTGPRSSFCASGKCDNVAGRFEADMAAVNRNWPGDTQMQTIEDAYRVNVRVGDRTITAGTHLFGDTVNVIPYHNDDAIEDVDGNRIARGDGVLAQYFAPGEIGIAVKHHRPDHRTLDINGGDSYGMKENFKLQDTHVELVVGVERDGQPGVITLNNPQAYEGGRFGDEHYSMVFLRPSWPEYLGQGEITQFQDNIRTMMLGFNAVSVFPGDYNGGDPLAARNPEQVRNHVAQMVRAIAGDAQARAFFEDPQNKIYCAELAFVSYSAGLIQPLSASAMVPVVGQDVWDRFVAEVDKHNRGEASAFTTLNRNQYARFVRIKIAEDSLGSAASYAPADIRAAEEGKLAFRPMTMSDIVEQFMRTHIPREELGEALAPVQGAILNQMRPALFEAMGIDRLPATDPARAGADQLFSAIVAAVSMSYADYDAFRTAIEPLLAQARMATGPRGDTGTGLFAPPSLMHVVAQGAHDGGLIGLDYVGHGLHYSLVRGLDAPTDPVDPGPQVQTVESVDLTGATSPGEQYSYFIRPAEGTTTITIDMLSESLTRDGAGNKNGNVQLFVGRNRAPSAANFDCGPPANITDDPDGNGQMDDTPEASEQCVFNDVTPNDIFYVKVIGWSGQTNYYLYSSAQ